jgi:hypothetical protein
LGSKEENEKVIKTVIWQGVIIYTNVLLLLVIEPRSLGRRGQVCEMRTQQMHTLSEIRNSMRSIYVIDLRVNGNTI